MSSPLISATLALLVGVLAYVLPVERVVAELARAREDAPPLRIEARLSGIVPAWPERVVLELHPDFGLRVIDDQGGQWLMRQGQFVMGNSPRTPLWIPDIEILGLRDEQDLLTWLARARVDLGRNELARCGESDCYVLGGIGRGGQVWLEKESFEVLRLVLPGGRELLLEGYASWTGIRFPRTIKVLDTHGELATLTIESLSRARDLSEEDFLAPLSPG